MAANFTVCLCTANSGQADLEAEEAAELAAEASAAAFREMEPPDDIEVPNGLSPQRARLVRYVGWLARLRGELDDAVSGRAAFLATMKVPSLTRAAIQQLIADDKSGLVGLMTRGGEGVSMHSLRSHERKLLLEQLVADEHAAEVAGSALTEVEKTIDSLERQIQVVSGRHGEFVAAVVQEHILSGVGATLTEQMDRIQASGLDVMGAHGAIAALRNVSHFPRLAAMVLPTPRFTGELWHSAAEDRAGYGASSASGYEVRFRVHDQEASKRKWLARAKLLLADPHASLDGDELMPTIIAHMQGVATAENVVVNPGLKRLLDKAGLQPPPPGQVLAIRHVNDQLAAANMTTDKRLDVKNALVRMRMVEIGKRVDVFR